MSPPRIERTWGIWNFLFRDRPEGAEGIANIECIISKRLFFSSFFPAHKLKGKKESIETIVAAF